MSSVRATARCLAVAASPRRRTTTPTSLRLWNPRLASGLDAVSAKYDTRFQPTPATYEVVTVRKLYRKRITAQSGGNPSHPGWMGYKGGHHDRRRGCHGPP